MREAEAVAAEAVGAERVDRDHQHVRPLAVVATARNGQREHHAREDRAVVCARRQEAFAVPDLPCFAL
jgi:hypothetical protein